MGDGFKLLTEIASTHAHSYTQNDRCLMWVHVSIIANTHYVFIGPECVYVLYMWGEHDSTGGCRITEGWDGGVITDRCLILNDR